MEKHCKVIFLEDINGIIKIKNKNGNLLIISDEEITHNDWVLLPNNEIHKMSPTDMIHYLASQSKATKKIIATTDTSLGLPQPSQQFIEKYIEEYNKDNIITEVEVEYEGIYGQPIINGSKTYKGFKLKVNLDNTINIKSVKDSWSRKEVIELLHKSLDANIVFNNKFNEIFHEQLDKWIETNL